MTSKRVYLCRKPITARDYVVSVGDVNSTSIAFGISQIDEITTTDGPALMVQGSNCEADWGNPIYTNFLIFTGRALRPRHSAGPECYKLRDRFYVRGVGGKHNVPVQRRKSRKIVALYLYEVKLPPRPLLDWQLPPKQSLD